MLESLTSPTPPAAPSWRRSCSTETTRGPRRLSCRELDAKHNHYVAARVDDKLVGYAGIARLGRKPPYEYEIHTIGVDPAYQGQGIGRRMLDGLLEFAEWRNGFP